MRPARKLGNLPHQTGNFAKLHNKAPQLCCVQWRRQDLVRRGARKWEKKLTVTHKNCMKFMQYFHAINNATKLYRSVSSFWIGNDIESNVSVCVALKRPEKLNSWKSRGYVPQCPIAGDANGCVSEMATFHWARKLVFTSFPVGNIVRSIEIGSRISKWETRNSASTPTSDSEIRVSEPNGTQH